MAATTLATSLTLIGDYEMRALVYDHFVKPDPLVARMPMVRSPGGHTWTQNYTTEPSGAAEMVITDSMTSSAFTKNSYGGYLNLIYKQDDSNMGVEALGEGQQGYEDDMVKKDHIVSAVSKKLRQRMMDGNPATVAIGADVTSLGVTAVEVGPRKFTFEQVTGATTTLGKIKWVLAAKTLQYKAPGADYYGAAQTISASNCHRVPLFSGQGADGTDDPARWIYVTVDWATISIAGNFESDTTAAKGLTYTPSDQMTGLLTQVNPDMAVWGNLAAMDAGNVPGDGTSPNRSILSWLRMKLLDGSNDNPSRCAIVCNDSMMLALEGVIANLGGGVNPVMFMGQEMNALNYGGIILLRNRWIGSDITSKAGNRSDLSQILGVVLGEDSGVHMKYATFQGNPVLDEVSGYASGAVASDETPGGTSFPFQYWKEKESARTLAYVHTGLVYCEPVAAAMDKLACVYGLVA